MPSNPAKPFLVSRTDDPQLQLLNEKISKLAAVKPTGDAFSAFALAAHLAGSGHRGRSRARTDAWSRHECSAANHLFLERNGSSTWCPTLLLQTRRQRLLCSGKPLRLDGTQFPLR